MERVYVGNLPPDIRIKDIDDFFRPFGKLIYIDVNHRANPVYAYVQFDSARNAFNAVKARHGYDYEGYTLQMRLVENEVRKRRDATPPPPPPPMINDYGNSRMGGNYSNSSMSSFQSSSNSQWSNNNRSSMQSQQQNISRLNMPQQNLIDYPSNNRSNMQQQSMMPYSSSGRSNNSNRSNMSQQYNNSNRSNMQQQQYCNSNRSNMSQDNMNYSNRNNSNMSLENMNYSNTNRYNMQQDMNMIDYSNNSNWVIGNNGSWNSGNNDGSWNSGNNSSWNSGNNISWNSGNNSSWNNGNNNMGNNIGWNAGNNGGNNYNNNATPYVYNPNDDPYARPGFEDSFTRGLSGSGRKWFNRYIRKGFSPEMSRSKALEHRTVPYLRDDQKVNPDPNDPTNAALETIGNTILSLLSTNPVDNFNNDNQMMPTFSNWGGDNFQAGFDTSGPSTSNARGSARMNQSPARNRVSKQQYLKSLNILKKLRAKRVQSAQDRLSKKYHTQIVKDYEQFEKTSAEPPRPSTNPRNERQILATASGGKTYTELTVTLRKKKQQLLLAARRMRTDPNKRIGGAYKKRMKILINEYGFPDIEAKSLAVHPMEKLQPLLTLKADCERALNKKQDIFSVNKRSSNNDRKNSAYRNDINYLKMYEKQKFDNLSLRVKTALRRCLARIHKHEKEAKLPLTKSKLSKLLSRKDGAKSITTTTQKKQNDSKKTVANSKKTADAEKKTNEAKASKKVVEKKEEKPDAVAEETQEQHVEDNDEGNETNEEAQHEDEDGGGNEEEYDDAENEEDQEYDNEEEEQNEEE